MLVFNINSVQLFLCLVKLILLFYSGSERVEYRFLPGVSLDKLLTLCCSDFSKLGLT